MPTKFLHFDTYYSSYVTNSSNAATSDPNAYDVQFTLPAQISKVRRVALKSAEIPVTFGQTRGAVVSSNCAGYFAIKIGSTTYSFGMSSRTYDNITSFVSDFNDNFQTYVNSPSDKSGTLSVYTETGASGNQHFLRLTFRTSTTVTFIDGPLSRTIMGFRSDTDSGISMIFGARGRFNLNADNFLSMYIREIPQSDNSVSGKLMTFKIPVNATYGSVLYFNAYGNGFEQFIDVHASYNCTLDRMTVSLFDCWGYQLNPWGGDYNFTLAVDYDE